MTLEEVKAALAPFAKFAEVFTHNMLGVDYEQFYTKTATINGQDREFVLRGADFDKAKDAFDFLSGIEAKQAAKTEPQKSEEQKSDPEAEAKMIADAEAKAAAETTAAKAATETTAEPEAPAKKGKK